MYPSLNHQQNSHARYKCMELQSTLYGVPGIILILGTEDVPQFD